MKQGISKENTVGKGSNCVENNQFRMIKGYEGKYWIDPFGNIKNKQGKLMKAIDLGGGVKAIDLYGQGLRDRKLIQVLLVENFPELFDGGVNDEGH